jgi:orotidine-5'-phosphate decarboxylase
MYARAFFEDMDVDAVTVAPYMGEDSVTPFLEYEGKWVILLALTSNKGSHDFQLIEDKDGKPLYKHVLETSSKWAGTDKMMYVVGATQGSLFAEIRKSHLIVSCLYQVLVLKEEVWRRYASMA